MRPLHAACRLGDTERVRQLLDEQALSSEPVLSIALGHASRSDLLQ